MKQTLILRRVCSSLTRTLSSSCFHNRCFSSEEGLSWATSPQDTIAEKLVRALNSKQIDEALETFKDFNTLYGLPQDSGIVEKLISDLTYSFNRQWLRKASALVSLVSDERPELLSSEVMTKLCLSLSRSGLSIGAAAILRKMLRLHRLPPNRALKLIVHHLVETEAGTCLATNFLYRLCEGVARLESENKRDVASTMRPETVIFNLVLDACLGFEMVFRAERVVELMARLKVIADAHSVALITRIHEINNNVDDLKRYKACVDRASPSDFHGVFYDKLLGLYVKFENIGSVDKLVREICWHGDGGKLLSVSPKTFVVSIGSENLRDGLKLLVQPAVIDESIVLRMETKQELVVFEDKKLVLCDKALAKIVLGFKKAGEIDELSKLLLVVQKRSSSVRGSSLCCDVIEACARIGWLEFAHDVLDDVVLSDSQVGSYTYVFLLNMYFKKKMMREAKGLVLQMGKLVMEVDLCPKLVIVEYLSNMSGEASLHHESGLVDAFAREFEHDKEVPRLVYKLNSSVHFFCKAKMMEDATKAYRRMTDAKIRPPLQTFTSLIRLFFSIGMYRAITILWGDMQICMERENRVVNEDLCEYLLMGFLQGKNFERVMEIVDYMERHGMFIDKSMCKYMYLKLHYFLYKRLKTLRDPTEDEKDRLRFLMAFLDWAHIDWNLLMKRHD